MNAPAGTSSTVAASGDNPATTQREPRQFSSRLHECPEVMNPPQSAAQGCEAGNLNTGDVMGMGHVHRAAKARPADAVPPPLSEQELERAIDAAKDRMCAAPTREGRLIDQRTPARRRFMERVRGL